MHRLKLRPEIQMYPTWIYKDGIYDNVSPESVGVSDALAEALIKWSDRWDATYDLDNDPGNPQFSSPTAERLFWEDGQRLADRLRAELNGDWTVEFTPDQ